MQRAQTWKTWLVFWPALAIAYWLTGQLCIAASAMVANVSWMLFIPAGLSLTAGLLWGSRVWPGVLAGELLIGLTSGEPLGASLLMAAGNALDCALAGWWFHDRIGRRLEFDRVGDVVGLLLTELLVFEPVSTAMGMVALASSGHMPVGKLWSSAAAWYAANIFAKFLMAPTVLVWLRWSRPTLRRENSTELVALAFLTLLIGALGAGRWAIHGLPLPVTLIFVFPLLVWAAVRFVPSVGVTVGCVLGLFAFDAGLSGTGPFSADVGGDHFFYLNVFMGVCIGTAVFLTAAMGQQHKFEAEQSKLIDQLRDTSAQVKKLEDFVIFCAWTGRVQWKEKWISVEQFLQERFNVNVSHGISDEAMAAVRRSMLRKNDQPDQAGGNQPNPA